MYHSRYSLQRPSSAKRSTKMFPYSLSTRDRELVEVPGEACDDGEVSRQDERFVLRFEGVCGITCQPPILSNGCMPVAWGCEGIRIVRGVVGEQFRHAGMIAGLPHVDVASEPLDHGPLGDWRFPGAHAAPISTTRSARTSHTGAARPSSLGGREDDEDRQVFDDADEMMESRLRAHRPPSQVQHPRLHLRLRERRGRAARRRSRPRCGDPGCRHSRRRASTCRRSGRERSDAHSSAAVPPPAPRSDRRRSTLARDVSAPRPDWTRRRCRAAMSGRVLRSRPR